MPLQPDRNAKWVTGSRKAIPIKPSEDVVDEQLEDPPSVFEIFESATKRVRARPLQRFYTLFKPNEYITGVTNKPRLREYNTGQ